MPTFTVTGDKDPFLHVSLRRGEKVYTESGSMVCMDSFLELRGKLRGGFFSSLGRALANGESLFQTTIEASKGDGDALLAPALPGDIWLLDVGPRHYRLNDGAFLAAEDKVEIRVRTQRLGQAIFGGTGGLFVMETAGSGKLAISSFGTIYALDVKPGSEMVVDNTHVVAWDAALEYRVSTMSNPGSGFLGNLFNSATSGEGLINRFTGQGQVLVCSRNRDSLSGWLSSRIGSR